MVIVRDENMENGDNEESAVYTLHNRICEFCVMLFVKEKINVMKELPTGKIKVQIKVDSFHFAILQGF